MEIKRKEMRYVVLEEGFSVQIFYDGLLTQFWLGHKDYGIQLYMFGVPEDVKDNDINKFLTGIGCYIDCYKDNYMEDSEMI